MSAGCEPADGCNSHYKIEHNPGIDDNGKRSKNIVISSLVHFGH